MITDVEFDEGMEGLKSAFNLKDFPKDTTQKWFKLLKDTGIQGSTLLRAMDRVATYEDKWFAVGSNLVGKVMKAVYEIRALDRETARLQPEQKQVQKPDDPLADNVEFNTAMKEYAENRFGVNPEKAKAALEKMDKIIKQAEEG